MICSVLLIFITISVVTGAPNTVKTAFVETQYAPKVAVGAAGVSASWGGYSASAGLGGEAGGTKGGLYAAADSPHGKAAAGLGGSVGGSAQGGLFAGAEHSQDKAATAEIGGYIDKSAKVGVVAEDSQNKVGGVIGGAVKGGVDTSVNSESSAGSSSSAGAGIGGGVYVTKGIYTTKVVNPQPAFFDRVFNIPISVLQSVNTYLNNRGPMKRVYVQGGASVSGSSGKILPATNTGGEVTGVAQAAGTGYGKVLAVVPAGGLPEVTGSAHAAHSSGVFKVATYETKPNLRSQVAGGSSVDGAIVVHKPLRNYDQIFNIPITALKSVNHLLNG